MKRTGLLGVAMVLGLTACPGSTVLDASRFDQTCSSDSHCIVVFSGDVCAVCQCANDAINSGSLTAWNTERSRAVQWCGPQPAIACAPCPPMNAKCVQGKCAAVPPP
ncbi:MAG: hypothetical protein AMXMBFR34_41840 [Myxococcaceae bacterium]